MPIERSRLRRRWSPKDRRFLSTVSSGAWFSKNGPSLAVIAAPSLGAFWYAVPLRESLKRKDSGNIFAR